MRTSLIVLLLWIPLSVGAAEVSLAEFLKQAWESSPAMQAEKYRGQASDEFVKAARGKYYPHVSLEAIDTTGFPGSSSLLHVGGLMGSPFRSGLAGGVILEQTVYDFGRIQSALDQAKSEKSLAEARLAEEKWRFLTSLGRLYLACARSRALQDEIENLMSWEQLILKETGRFTRTGQRSIIDNALIKSEVNDLVLQESELKKFQSSLNEQMAAYVPSVSCKALSVTLNSTLDSRLTVEDPGTLLAKAQAEVARAGFLGARANQRPRIDVMGSAGGMDKTRLVRREDFSAGVAVVFPVWDGGEDAHREEALKTEVDFENQNLKLAQVEYSNKLKSLRDDFERSRETLKDLEGNLEQIRGTVKLASKRYRSMEGPLIDVRESYNQLKGMENQRVQLLYSLSETSLLLSMLRR